MVWSEGNVLLKNPVTPPGIDPVTVRLVAQRLNHYATPGPSYSRRKVYKFAAGPKPTDLSLTVKGAFLS